MSRWSASRRAKNISKQEKEIDLSLHIPFKEVLAPRPRLPSRSKSAVPIWLY
jgi:hypothetical protein